MLMMAKMAGMVVVGGDQIAATTWNPLDKDVAVTLSDNNLTASATVNNRSVRGTKPARGRDYYELAIVSGATVRYGVANLSMSQGASPGADVNGVGYWGNTGQIRGMGSIIVTIATYTGGDRVMCFYEKASNKVWFGKNGVWDGNPSLGTGGYSCPTGDIYPIASPGSGGQVTAAFSAASFAYEPPAGAVPWGL